MFETAIQAGGDFPVIRAGKCRCTKCGEWIVNQPVDRAIHARQERVGMQYLRGLSNWHFAVKAARSGETL